MTSEWQLPQQGRAPLIIRVEDTSIGPPNDLLETCFRIRLLDMHTGKVLKDTTIQLWMLLELQNMFASLGRLVAQAEAIKNENLRRHLPGL